MAGPSPARPPDIRGNTLRVYLYLSQSGPSELRDVQRTLGFSTPSLASYHLGKLVEAGYAAQDEHGRYLVSRDATKEILEGYVKVGAVLVPQLLFFSVLFTAVIVFLAAASLRDDAYVPTLAVASLGAAGALWFETARLWRRLASWK